MNLLLFAPDRVRQRSKDWGNAAFNARIHTALEGFITANGWLRVTTHTGSDALGAVYQTVLSGQARPEEGHMVSASAARGGVGPGTEG